MVMPFNKKIFRKPNIFQWIFNIHPKSNAIIEINNLLADAPSVTQILAEDIQAIARKYKINLFAYFSNEFESFYKDQLLYCLRDRNINQDEQSELVYLKSIFKLRQLAVDHIHKEVGELIYTESVQDALSDGKIEPAGKASLKKVQEVLKLPDDDANRIYSEKAKNYLEKYLNSIISTQRFSYDDEKNFYAIATNLGVKITYENETKNLLAKYRLYWLIENGEIPTIETDINLTRGEKCYFSCYSKWYENKRVTKRIRYSGPTLRLKIAKGVYWRMGDLGFQTVTSDILSHIDSGRLFLTNKRLIFMGDKKNTSIRLSNILDIKMFKNGVELQKSAGNNPFFEFDDNVDIFAMMLGRALKNSY